MPASQLLRSGFFTLNFSLFQLTHTMSNITIIPEKQTFRAEVLVDSEHGEVRIVVKCSINFERLTHKCTPIFTTIHEGTKFNIPAMEAKDRCVEHCDRLLNDHRAAHGLERQLSFEFADSDSDTDDEPLRASA